MFLCIGVLLVVVGLILRGQPNTGSSNVEVLETDRGGSKTPLTFIVVDVSGAVKSPGVYRLPVGSRVEEVLTQAHGLSDIADKNWVDKNLNRASKVVDGQKIFIPPSQQKNTSSATVLVNETNVAQSNSEAESGMVNINTASLTELDVLPGIGPVYGQNIIDNRPYSDPNELLSKGVLKESIFNKIKDKITAY